MGKKVRQSTNWKNIYISFFFPILGLESQLLGIVVRKERPALEEQKDTLVVSIASGKKSLIELEDELLRLLLNLNLMQEYWTLTNTIHFSYIYLYP